MSKSVERRSRFLAKIGYLERVLVYTHRTASVRTVAVNAALSGIGIGKDTLLRRDKLLKQAKQTSQ